MNLWVHTFLERLAFPLAEILILLELGFAGDYIEGEAWRRPFHARVLGPMHILRNSSDTEVR
jgi:hypothetical protein